MFGHNNANNLLPFQSCNLICALVAPGSFCRFTLFGDETCNRGSFAFSLFDICDLGGPRGACHCGNISESLQQQEGPTVNQLLDLTGVADENKTNELNNVVAKCTGVQTGASAGFGFDKFFKLEISSLFCTFCILLPNAKKCWTEECWRGVLQKKCCRKVSKRSVAEEF